MDIPHLISRAATLQHGAALFVLTFAAVQLWSAKHPATPTGWLGLSWLPKAAMFGWLVFLASYLAYPIYADHVEGSAVVIGLHLRQGQPIYPMVHDYGMAGLLYGPLLPMLNALAVSAPIDPVLATKLLAATALLTAIALTAFNLPDRRAWLYLMFLAPYDMLAYNRAEPYLLLLTALACHCAHVKGVGLRALILGCLAGLAAALKLHGVLYIVAAYVLVMPREQQLRQIMVAAIGALATLWACFTPQGALLSGYVHYLAMASGHGLHPRLLLDNGIVLFALWLPLIWLHSRTSSSLSRQWMVILTLQMLVLLLASKKGAGSWHLLPFVLVNAQLLGQTLEKLPESHSNAVRLALAPTLTLCLGAALVLGQQTWQHWRQAAMFRDARSELLGISARRDRLVIATGETKGYELSYMRIYLEQQGVPQIDYPAYLDLQLAGVTEKPVVQALDKCVIGHLAVPKGQRPFAYPSSYTGKPLFSQQLRQVVAKRFEQVEQGRHFDVLKCRPATSEIANPVSPFSLHTAS